MISLKLFLLIYLIGGITFLPLIALGILYVNGILDGKDEGVREQADSRRRETLMDPDFKAAEFEEAKGVHVTRQGWVSVTTKYYYFHTEIPSSANSDNTSEAGEFPERSQLKKKHKFYAVIKHGNLFLYRDNSPKSNLIHAISLQDSFVTLWPRDTKHEIPDSALFSKRTCISILRKGATSLKNGELGFTPNESSEDDTQTASQFFLYFGNNMEKEDWYFDLINVSKNETTSGSKTNGLIDPNVSARAAHLRTADMLYLIQTINSTEGQLTTKWINAILGRLFLSLQRTETLKYFFHERLYQKLSKVKKPDFLDDFVVEEVDVGNSAPIFTNPKLIELSLEGLTKISCDFLYKGDLSVLVSTKATINLGSRFKQREVALQLSLKLKELSGPLIFLMKPPPSNRVWYTFKTEPILDVEVEPVVSSNKLSYNMITNAIKGKFAEALKESLVQPNWDDIVFFSTEKDIYRGGIWENYGKSDEEEKKSSTNSEPPSHDKRASFSNLEKDISKNDNSQISNRESDNDVEDTEKDSCHDDASMKRRSSQKIENFRRILKTKSKEEFDDEHVQTEKASQASPFNEENDDLSGSKKYFKNPIKKLNKWYKEAVNIDMLDNDSTNTNTASGAESSVKNVNTPEMISNRRTSIPRRPRPSNINQMSHSATDSQLANISQPLNSTEMFVNKNKDEAQSSSSNDIGAPPFLSNNYSTMPVRAFVKMEDTKQFPGEYVVDPRDDPRDDPTKSVSPISDHFQSENTKRQQFETSSALSQCNFQKSETEMNKKQIEIVKNEIDDTKKVLSTSAKRETSHV